MQIKIHESYRKIIALADSNLIGKTFTQDNKQIKVKSSFFEDKEKNKEEILKILKEMDKEDATFYIVGEESIESALESKIISKEGIMTIDGIPIALVLL